MRGGESAVGWKIGTGLSRFHEVTLLCGDLAPGEPTKTELEHYRAQNGYPSNLSVVHVPAPALARALYRFHKLPGCWFGF